MTFPNDREKKLGAALVKYCSELAESSRLDEGSQESMNIAMECLQQVFQFEEVPSSDVDLLTAVAGPGSGAEEKGDEQKSTEYCDFIWEIQSKGYFKGCEVGDDEYMNRLKKAFGKFNERFPDTPVEECDLSWTDRVNQAVTAKNAGNTALKNKEFEKALSEYTKAIRLNPGEATFYSNRSACHMHTRNAKLAEEDANRAIQRRPEWAKGYMRLGAAKKLGGDLPGAIKAYRQGLTKCAPEDPLWTQINEHIESCEKEKAVGTRAANPLAGMMGGMPGGMGGGPGGMPDFASMMNNPMMQQMAQKFMSDPNMMEKVQGMMQDPAMMEMAKNMMSGMGMPGPPGGMPGMPGMPGGSADAGFMELMQDPARMQEVLKKVSEDPELQAMKDTDPESASILEGLASGDMGMGMQLMQKPDLMVKLRSLVSKHM